jgi:hypothetical protein
MPILGILASSKLIAAAGDYESIATVTVGSGGASTITFDNIAADWTHLQLRCFHLNGTANQGANLRINNDTGGNYARHYVGGEGSVVVAGGSGSLSNISMYFFVGNSNASNPLVEIIDILDYANTNKTKTIRALVGVDNNGSGEVNLVSGFRNNTAAITRLDIVTTAGNFNQYSHFALYGIKGA